MSAGFARDMVAATARRLAEPRRFLQVLAGPRQVGKTTVARQVMERYGGPVHYASADAPGLESGVWLEQQWEAGRLLVKPNGRSRRSTHALLVLDEVQKIAGWSEIVKKLWDEDSSRKLALKVLLLGSSPLLIQRGLTESLAGRFELIRIPHWSYREVASAFKFSLEQYIFFGGFPGAAPLVRDAQRWMRYIQDSIIETTISRDILLMTRVDKPALLRRTFQLACEYSGQILSYQKMTGRLQDAGNTTTLAHYLELLGGAGFVLGLEKYSGRKIRQRGSSPKLQVLNTALMSAALGLDFSATRKDPEVWGRLVESAVGAHLVNQARLVDAHVTYWRDKNREVDFVVQSGKKLFAIEVKSGARPRALPGIEMFRKEHPEARPLLVGPGGIPLDQFLGMDLQELLR